MEVSTQTQPLVVKKEDEKIKWKPLLVLAKVVVVISIFGFVWQFIEITFNYQKKEVVTRTLINVPRIMKLPDISICVRLTHSVNYTELKAQHPEFVESLENEYPEINSSESYAKFISTGDFYDKIFRNIVSNFTLRQMNKFLFRADDVIERCSLISNTGYGVLNSTRFNEQCKWKMYALEMNVCYLLSCSQETPYIISERDLSQSKYKGTMLTMFIKHSVFKLIDNIELYLHTPTTYPRGQQNPFVLIHSEDYATMTFITYTRFESNRLPSPFASNCSNYKSEDQRFATRLDKIEHCQNAHSIQRLKVPFYGNVHSLDLNLSHGYLYYLMDYGNATIQRIADEIFNKCKEIAEQQDCKEEHYIPIESQPRTFAGKTSIIILKAPTQPDIILKSYEKLSLTQYLILVESLLATWFGFCVAGAMPQLYTWTFYSAKKIKKIGSAILKK